jgi:Conjugal transfer protein TraD
MDRRARTRKLIELGGLVQKSGLVAAANDDRALLLGALVLAARNLENPDAKEKRERWRAIGEEEMGASSNSWSGR